MTTAANKLIGVELFHAPGFRVELRALKNGEPKGFLYDHHELDELLKEAQRQNADGFACYHTINPLDPNITQHAGDAGVVRIAWLPYDIDPIRPSGVSASDEEKAKAWNVAERVLSYWQGRGIAPAVVDSGNGYYVLVPVDLEKKDAGAITGVLKAHAEQFNTDSAKIDISVGNPSRILRVPGTMNRKGENTPERPHRMCEIVEAGSRDRVLKVEDLQRIAPESKPLPIKPPDDGKFDAICEMMRANFERMELPEYEEETASHGGVNFVFEECLVEPHSAGNNTSQIGIRPDGVLTFHCFHDSHQLNWAKAKPQIEARYGSKFEFGDVYKGPAVVVGGGGKEATAPTPDVGFTLTGPHVEGTPYDFVLNPLPGKNDGWFPRGDISLVAAMSGGGKTTLMADLLEKQLKGEPVYGHATNKLPYLVVMEDRGAFSMQRTLKRLGIDQKNFPYERMSGGGLAAGVQRAILAQPTMPAVVFLEGIDLLGDASDGRDVSKTLKQLQQVAEHYHVAIVGTTGSPKQKAKDRYVGLRDQIIGSTVWARKTETIIVLQRESGKETDEFVDMVVLPRQDKPEQFRLAWDKGRFRMLTEAEIKASEAKKVEDGLLGWVTDQDTFTRAQLKAAFPKMSGRTLTHRLEGLVNCGLVKPKTKGNTTTYSVAVPGLEPTAQEVETGIPAQ